MNKVKVVFVISNLGQGGAERQFVHLIKYMDVEKFDITVFLYACQSEPFYNDLRSCKNIKLVTSKLKFNNSFMKIGEALISIRKFLNENCYDLVVTTLFMNNLFVRIAAPNQYNNRVITNIRTSFKNYSSFYRFFEKILISKSYIVFNNKKALYDFKKLFSKKYLHRLSCIYNGYEIPTESKVISSDLVFGSLGRLSVEKNVIQAVRVFHLFEKDFMDARYIVQGHFSNQHTVIQQVSKSANIEIREKDSNVESFYDSINILILPSIFEGCPNVLFEALLRKKICIISDGANSDNFIQDGINGFVYDGTDDGLLESMKTVQKLFATSDYNDVLVKGHQFALNGFSISSMVEQYQKLFLEIYEKNKSCN